MKVQVGGEAQARGGEALFDVEFVSRPGYGEAEGKGGVSRSAWRWSTGGVGSA